jgi:hypothetical protein
VLAGNFVAVVDAVGDVRMIAGWAVHKVIPVRDALLVCGPESLILSRAGCSLKRHRETATGLKSLSDNECLQPLTISRTK